VRRAQRQAQRRGRKTVDVRCKPQQRLVTAADPSASTVSDVIAWLMARSAEEGDCWIWQRAVNSVGCPVATVDGVSARSVRNWARSLLKGDAAGKKVVCECQHDRCVNPKHWRVLTPGALNEWLWKHGRMNTLAVRTSRAANGRTQSDLDLRQVRAMRSRRAKGEILRTIARDFKVTISCASRICRGDSWHDHGNAMAEMCRTLK